MLRQRILSRTIPPTHRIIVLSSPLDVWLFNCIFDTFIQTHLWQYSPFLAGVSPRSLSPRADINVITEARYRLQHCTSHFNTAHCTLQHCTLHIKHSNTTEHFTLQHCTLHIKHVTLQHCTQCTLHIKHYTHYTAGCLGFYRGSLRIISFTLCTVHTECWTLHTICDTLAQCAMHTIYDTMCVQCTYTKCSTL